MAHHWLSELAQRLRLDLSDAFAGDAELAPNFFQSPILPIFKTEAHDENATFALR